ncbi:hypothetical protein FJD34_08450 [Pseudomonas brenneri]|uniref:Uncharacterized protein n=1 Tax=Pseudomonas brenneri TaxID=129817 RepID=A0A5B2UYQ7_9PSED|nr:hypothetical protein [Pseudomonas brenneri]KAA2231105.1 hypothetical protein F1720_09160 [Pseudomonas brenneri]TWR80305.1 hypothetical protein FJD34_08450 [Pseudomonas brenneri]
MLAKIVNDNAGILNERAALASFVGTPPGAKLAPTGFEPCFCIRQVNDHRDHPALDLSSICLPTTTRLR